MFEKQNIMKGMKSLDAIKKQEEERLEKEGEDPDKDVKMFKLPAAMFEDFAEIDHRNDEMFEFLAFNVVINYLEQICLKKGEEWESEEERLKATEWSTALEFPIVIASAGRSMLHEVANYFNLSHHSRGGKASKPGKPASKNRQTIMYPKSLFKEKQQRERNRLLKQRDQIREKYTKKTDFTGIPPVNPSTFTEQCIREIYEEKFAKVPNKNASSFLTTNMLDEALIGLRPDPKEIERLIELKKIDLARIEKNMEKKVQRAKE